MSSVPTPLTTLADGTVKQINPFSGTEVWTVPGRGNRPLGIKREEPQPLTDDDYVRRDAFGSANKRMTPPEKARVVRAENAPALSAETEPLQRGADGVHVRDIGHGFYEITGILPDQLDDTIAEFRRVPNLFEIVTYDYWHSNYGFAPDEAARRRMARYIADPAGRAHVANIIRVRLKAAGVGADVVDGMTEGELMARAPGYFAGGHDVIIARRHFTDGATNDDQLASSGTLSVDEHRAFVQFTIETMADLYRRNRYVRYVAAFQNWLKPAGASFDHLHKQLVAIDEYGEQLTQEVTLLRKQPNMYNEYAVDYAARRNLIIAENEHAVAFAGFGHRYPTLEVYSKSATCEPWLQSEEEVAAMSDLIHACHAATGADVPCNEEWHHRPVDLDERMPWRVMLKWRVSNLAGFEGGTKIYLNTVSPWDMRDRVVPKLYQLRDEGRISRDIHIATECSCHPNLLRYNPLVDNAPRL
ncbi:DUF4921 family protein [Corynebacterium sp. TAE3-ERU12]|uniref:DUF4921 family protein n=1 Tax=Corynebacterium sp. TAE3-ERU12 TaxID=2849491 RepID=UPI001C48735D|nr:DUF4921 family protein [Corynebacterium sp. TAE3-ERU12]MBV7296157.1 DUF4921 family protein [Corynebacterium sp. TAE3-ERU12]